MNEKHFRNCSRGAGLIAILFASACATAYPEAKRAIQSNEQVEFVVVSAPISGNSQASGKFVGQYLPQEFDSAAESAAGYFKSTFPTKQLTIHKGTVSLPKGTPIEELFKRDPALNSNGISFKFISFIDPFYSVCGGNQVFTCMCVLPRVAFLETQRLSDPNYRMSVFNIGENRCWKPDDTASVTYNAANGTMQIKQGAIPGGVPAAVAETIKTELPQILGSISQADAK